MLAEDVDRDLLVGARQADHDRHGERVVPGGGHDAVRYVIGAVVNGAGLAMATMDLIKFYGGEPANFLDIGGSSNPEKVVNALKIITADPNVKVICFNIFGGITRCDDVANGIVEATRRIQIDVPLVIRLTGTNEKIAVEILEKAGFSATTSMDDVVQKAVELAKKAA